MSGIRPVALGRLIAAITIGSVAVASDGTLTPGTDKSLSGVLLSLKTTQKNTHQEISPITSRIENNVIISTATNVELSGYFLLNDVVSSSATNQANYIAQTSDYVVIKYTIAGVATVFYGVVEEFVTEASDKGKITFNMTVAMIDIGSTNPVQT